MSDAPNTRPFMFKLPVWVLFERDQNNRGRFVVPTLKLKDGPDAFGIFTEELHAERMAQHQKSSFVKVNDAGLLASFAIAAENSGATHVVIDYENRDGIKAGIAPIRESILTYALSAVRDQA